MIVDANVLIAATIGRSFPLIARLNRDGHDLLVPAEQFRETELNGLRLAADRGLDGPALLKEVFDLVQRVDGGIYSQFETTARVRLDETAKAQKDWPLLALALATGDAIWTNDRDLFGTGVTTWRTVNIGFVPPVIAAADDDQ